MRSENASEARGDSRNGKPSRRAAATTPPPHYTVIPGAPTPPTPRARRAPRRRSLPRQSQPSEYEMGRASAYRSRERGRREAGEDNLARLLHVLGEARRGSAPHGGAANTGTNRSIVSPYSPHGKLRTNTPASQLKFSGAAGSDTRRQALAAPPPQTRHSFPWPPRTRLHRR